MLKEFKEFAMRGNVVDMAVGIIIGAAFGGIIGGVVQAAAIGFDLPQQGTAIVIVAFAVRTLVRIYLTMTS